MSQHNYGTRKSSASAPPGKDSSESSEKQTNCGTCAKVCRASEKVLLCQSCDRFFHSQCQNIDDQKYEVLRKDAESENPSTFWFCNSSCSLFARKFITSVTEIRMSLEHLKSEVKKVSDDVTKVDERVLDIERGLLTDEHEGQVRRIVREEIESDSFDRVSDQERAEQMVDGKVEDAVSAAVREIHDRQNRKKGFVVHGIPMSTAPDLKSRIEHDNRCFDKLCSKGLNLKKKVVPKKIIRLGKKEDEKRPMKVILSSSESVIEIMKATKNLAGKDFFKNVQISSDRTPLERRERRKLMELREQLQVQADEEGSGVKWIMKGNRVVKEIEEETQQPSQTGSGSNEETWG